MGIGGGYVSDRQEDFVAVMYYNSDLLLVWWVELKRGIDGEGKCRRHEDEFSRRRNRSGKKQRQIWPRHTKTHQEGRLPPER
jgi:hypothetical protein